MSILKKIPEQIRRLSIVFLVLLAVFLVVRAQFVPSDFGELGHYRTSSLKEILSQEMKYAGSEICNDCHDEVVDEKKIGNHKNVSCEVCHGALAQHIDSPDKFLPLAPRERTLCPVCHEYLQARPSGFPQIVSDSHNPIKPCITCHNPHNPVTPETPSDCSACHATIARTKSISHHAYVKCTQCHNVPEQHKLNPRANLPDKPTSREFCGGCHSIEADSNKGIPRIDMVDHENKYVCWQCHYPHLPEAK